MGPSLADTIKVNTPVWVWDGHWLPAVVVGPGFTREFLVVRFEHGVSAPMPSANIRPRWPSLRGADTPSTIAALVADLARSRHRSPEALNLAAARTAQPSTPQRLDGVSVLVVDDEAYSCEALGTLHRGPRGKGHCGDFGAGSIGDVGHATPKRRRDRYPDAAGRRLFSSP